MTFSSRPPGGALVLVLGENLLKIEGSGDRLPACSSLRARVGLFCEVISVNLGDLDTWAKSEFGLLKVVVDICRSDQWGNYGENSSFEVGGRCSSCICRLYPGSRVSDQQKKVDACSSKSYD